VQDWGSEHRNSRLYLVAVGPFTKKKPRQKIGKDLFFMRFPCMDLGQYWSVFHGKKYEE